MNTEKKIKKFKKAYKYLIGLIDDDSAMANVIGKELLINSIKYGPEDYRKAWIKTYKRFKNDETHQAEIMISKIIDETGN